VVGYAPEKCSVRHSLRIGSDAIVSLGSQWYNGGVKTGQNLLDRFVASTPIPVRNDDLSTVSL